MVLPVVLAVVQRIPSDQLVLVRLAKEMLEAIIQEII
jgi:hypothetical protein